MISVVLVAFGLVFLFVLGDVGYKRWISFKSEKLATQEFLEALNEENQKISRELVQSQVELAAFKQRDSVTPDQHFLNVLEAHVKTMNQMILDQFLKALRLIN